MPKQQLNGTEIGAGLEQMNRKRMAQGVRRDRLGDTGLTPHGSADVLHGGSRNRLAGQVAGKQPLLWSNCTIVVPQDVQQPGRQHDVAIFPPFALLDADGHALIVDRRGRQANRLRNAQTRGVADGEDHAVLEVLDSVEKPDDLFRAHHDRKRLWPAAGRDDVIDVPSALQRDVVEKTNGGDRHTDRTGGKLFVCGQIELKGPDLGWAEQFWRLTKVARELRDVLQIRALRVRREVTDLHVLDHALTKRRHRPLIHRLTVQRDVVEKADAGERYTDRAGGEFSFSGQIELKGADLGWAEQFWRLVEVARELRDVLQIRGLRVRREVAGLHVFDHALTKWRHPPLFRRLGMKCDVVEKANGGDRHADRTGGEFPFSGQMELKSVDLGWAEQFRRLTKVACELRDVLEVCALRVRREVAGLHVFDHTLTKRRH